MWYNLGLALDVPDSILDDIKDQCKANPEQCMVEMVDSWMTRQMHVGKPTWTDLAAGLRKIKQTWLADALENIYNTGMPAHTFTPYTDFVPDGIVDQVNKTTLASPSGLASMPCPSVNPCLLLFILSLDLSRTPLHCGHSTHL